MLIEVDNNHICVSVNGEEAVHSGVIIPRPDTYLCYIIIYCGVSL